MQKQTPAGDPTEHQEIRFRRRGALAEIILTRPKALNALTLNMIELAEPYLKAWADNPAIQAVTIFGDGDKAFCAGGDVRAVAEAGKAGEPLTQRFFAEEYKLNRRIQKFPKPYMALMDGITMGGGVGVSVHGRHRIAGDKTVVAMPETGIGFFPDVGTTYVLSRMPGALGPYLALTGARLGPADAVYAGFATHYAPSEQVLAIPDALVNLGGDADVESTIARVLDKVCTDPGPAPLADYQAAIDRCFGHDTVEAILDALDGEGSDWARETRATLDRMSPTSMKLTLAALNRARERDFDACLQMEYRMSQHCMAGHDFYEGIRATLIDKDKSPKWSPARLADVDDATIEQYFEPLDGRDLVFED
jgi:enoyl-CoA hydratase